VEQNEVMCEEKFLDDADLMVVAFGTPSRIAKTAIHMAREKGMKVGLLRPITLFPFPSKQVHDRSERIGKILVVEMNTGQMLYDVKISAHKDADISFYGRPGGGVPFPNEVLAEIVKAMEK
jgi:2-oxoglutarate ferredoxin oxidoreductase subunit alpha